MKTSKHAKLRIKERTSFNHEERRNLFRNALDKGKSLNQLQEGEIKDFIQRLQNIRHCKVKLYLNYVFIYSKNSKILYTMYKLPDYLLDEKENTIII